MSFHYVLYIQDEFDKQYIVVVFLWNFKKEKNIALSLCCIEYEYRIGGCQLAKLVKTLKIIAKVYLY